MDIPCVRDVPNKSVGQLSAAAQADNAEKKILLNHENGPISRVLQFYSSQPTTIAA